MSHHPINLDGRDYSPSEIEHLRCAYCHDPILGPIATTDAGPMHEPCVDLWRDEGGGRCVICEQPLEECRGSCVAGDGYDAAALAREVDPPADRRAG